MVTSRLVTTGRREHRDPEASRFRRFLGALADYALFGLFYAVGSLWVVDAASEVAGYLGLYLWIAPVIVLQAVLVSVRGQSVGKIVARTRIQRSDGRRVGFVHGVLLRSWIMGWTSNLPALFLADALWVAGRRRCCLHDLLADTRVVCLASEERE